VETGGSLSEVRRKEQDQLFTDLRKASTPEKSHAIASRLRQSFVRTGSDSLDLMLRWAETALNQSREAEAQDYIDEVMAQRPDNATVWQLRARLHLRRNELAPALRDIRQAMILEPRNFDVLINYATLLRETGNRKGALRLYHQALSVYPMMKEAQDEMLKLTEADSDTAL
jgi:Tfp pilus assembly protein PilF